jgi:hypothetical protein
VVIKKSMKKMGAASLWRKLKGKKPTSTTQSSGSRAEKTLSDEIIQTVHTHLLQYIHMEHMEMEEE